MPAKRTLINRDCLNRGTEFRPAQQSSRFCSSKCWYDWPGRIEERECEACGTLYRPASKKQKACSVDCGNIIKRSPHRRTECLRCGGPLTKNSPSKVRYCSKKCGMEDRWAQGDYKILRSPIGTRKIDPGTGYVRVKTEKGWEFEHRLVLGEKIGRPLQPWPLEHVHHKDGVRANNDPSNLELRTGSTHGPGASKHCPTCTCED